MRTVFTTGEAADVCKVSQQTIIRCFDSGRLRGFKVPGSKFRRIPRAALVAFMKEHNIPLDALESGKTKVLLVGSECPGFVNGNGQDAAYELKAVSTGYEAGLLTNEFQPDVILMGILESAAEQVAICRAIRRTPELQHIRVVVSGKVAASQASELLQAGATMVADSSASIDGILEKLQPAA